MANEEALFVVVRVDKPASDALGAVAAYFASVRVKHIDALDLDAILPGLAVVSSVEKLRKLPFVPWESVWRVADKVGAATPQHPVVFECVGVPGVLEEIISHAPVYARVVVVGVCMVADTFRPMLAVGKELNLQFAFGYDPLEFTTTLSRIAEGAYDLEPMITAEVPLEGVADAFHALADPDAHAKILVIPN